MLPGLSSGDRLLLSISYNKAIFKPRWLPPRGLRVIQSLSHPFSSSSYHLFLWLLMETRTWVKASTPVHSPYFSHKDLTGKSEHVKFLVQKSLVVQKQDGTLHCKVCEILSVSSVHSVVRHNHITLFPKCKRLPPICVCYPRPGMLFWAFLDNWVTTEFFKPYLRTASSDLPHLPLHAYWTNDAVPCVYAGL